MRPHWIALRPEPAAQADGAEALRIWAWRALRVTPLVAQVDAALANFPRIVGLRDGALAFDLPAAAVTRELLARLYAQHEHELRGEPAVVSGDTPAEPPLPVAMHCR
jgi:phosphonate transport system ATP-binding protein